MKEEDKAPRIFLSYSWKDKSEASILEEDFKKIGIPLIKDTLNLKFKDSISDYMKSIRTADFAIILLSENYLKSKSCMFEALELLKEQNHSEKLLPILIEEPKIFTPQDRIKYIKFWQEEKNNLQKELQGIDVTSSIESYNDLKLIESIYSAIDGFLKIICDFKTSTLETLKKENYKSIIDYLGYKDISFVIDLLIISQIESWPIKEFAIEKHIEKFGVSSLALFSKALTKSNLNKKEEAKQFYEKSLELDDSNAATWNNLGYLLDSQFNQINKALECYKKAIELEPHLIEARINLATVYSRKNHLKQAKKEYIKILEIAPHESKAHNNIATIYRKYNQKDKVLYHLMEAIKYNSRYAEAYLNLGNYYDVQLNDFENAIQYYEIAKKIANNETMNLLVDTMIKLYHKRNNK